jgi:hypothetical protein
MPYHRNGCTGRDGVVRAEPGASASARLTRRQADHGRRRSVLLTWERGEVASMIYCTLIEKACSVFVYVLFLFLFRIARLCSDCPAFSDADLVFLL